MNTNLGGETPKWDGRTPGLRETIELGIQIYEENGIDLIAFASSWAENEKSRLGFPGVQEFEELCTIGCHPIALAGSLLLAECVPSLSQVVRNTLGRVDERPRNAKKLRDAAEVLQRFTPEKFDRLQDRLSKCNPDAPVSIYAIVRGLELYAKFFELAEAISRYSDIKSKNDLPRFIVTDYVQSACGRWHDRQVAGLLQGKSEDIYDEVTHRIWRNRNFRRLRGRYGFISDLLIETQTVLKELQGLRTEAVAR